MKAEDRFVERLRAILPASDRVLVGPGDDAAVVRRESGELVATTDLLVEGVDFLAGEDPERLGRRALAVNLSDIAAMGARPEFFLLSIGFAPRKGEDYPLGIARGALSRARPLKVRLVGGDLSSAPVTILSVALWGSPANRPILRSGAKPDDLLFLSGFPGRAAAGLAIAREMSERTEEQTALSREERELLDAYRDPEPRVALGLALASGGLARAAIDVSDGLGVDAARLARASGLRAVIEKEKIPVSPALATFAGRREKDPFEAILEGGDDYELLFAAPPGALAAIRALATREVPVTVIGYMEEGEGAFLRDGGKENDISLRGHDHFERER